MTAEHVRVTVGSGSPIIAGSSRVLVPAFKTLGARRQWDDRRKAWRVPPHALDDIVAYLEQRGGVLVDVERVSP